MFNLNHLVKPFSRMSCRALNAQSNKINFIQYKTGIQFKRVGASTLKKYCQILVTFNSNFAILVLSIISF